MPEVLDFYTLSRAPTPDRPLLGNTVLIVEDSRFASEALRLMSVRSGARIRRADSLASARRHLRVYRPTAVIIDLGLPDGSGLDLIADLAAQLPRIDVILATSGDEALAEAAHAAGADGFLAKPLTRLGCSSKRCCRDCPPIGSRRGHGGSRTNGWCPIRWRCVTIWRSRPICSPTAPGGPTPRSSSPRWHARQATGRSPRPPRPQAAATVR
jgi:CheY-like chemotaxis protein